VTPVLIELSAEDFDRLVGGQPVLKKSVCIRLTDLPFERMCAAIDAAAEAAHVIHCTGGCPLAKRRPRKSAQTGMPRPSTARDGAHSAS